MTRSMTFCMKNVAAPSSIIFAMRPEILTYIHKGIHEIYMKIIVCRLHKFNNNINKESLYFLLNFHVFDYYIFIPKKDKSLGNKY